MISSRLLVLLEMSMDMQCCPSSPRVRSSWKVFSCRHKGTGLAQLQAGPRLLPRLPLRQPTRWRQRRASTRLAQHQAGSLLPAAAHISVIVPTSSTMSVSNGMVRGGQAGSVGQRTRYWQQAVYVLRSSPPRRRSDRIGTTALLLRSNGTSCRVRSPH